MAAHDLATALSATTLEDDANPLRALPDGVLGLSLEKLHARDVAALREAAKDVITANDVPLLCRQIGGSRYDGVVRALARSKMTSPNKKRQTTESRNDAGEALASLRVAELEKIADGCATATEPRDDDSVRGYWLSKNWAQHLRRYYEQSRAKLLSPSQKGTPIRRRSRSNSGEALPPWPDANAEILCEHGFLCPRACARPGSKRVLVSRETWRAIQGRFPLSTKFKASTAAECLECSQLRGNQNFTVPSPARWRGDGGSPNTLFDLRTGLQCVQDRKEARALVRQQQDDERLERLREVDECSAHWWAKPKKPLQAALQRRSSPSSLLRGLLPKERARKGFPGGNSLSPGAYRLVPRAWLKKWRRSLAVSGAERPGPPTTSDCLCHAHGLPVIPAHVTAWLRGESVDLLPHHSQATDFDCEIVSIDEWRAINALFPVDYAIAFDVDGNGDVRWATEPCAQCDDGRRGDSFDVTFRARDYKRMGRCRPDRGA